MFRVSLDDIGRMLVDLISLYVDTEMDFSGDDDI